MSSKVEEFCSITGCDGDTARAFLQVCDNDMHIAVNMYMSDPSSVPIGSDPDYRAPIPQRTEVLVPAELPPYTPSRRPPHVTSAFSTVCSAAFSDEEVESESAEASTGSNGASSSVAKKNSKNKKQFMVNTMKNNSKNPEIFKHSASASSISDATSSTTTFSDRQVLSSGTSTRKQGVLRQLFAPPSDLIFSGCLREALIAARDNHKWLLLSLHDDSCFDCHILNRDVWKDYKVKDLIRRNFLFIQVDINSPDGAMYRSRYSYATSATQIVIMNPVSGDQEMMWTHLKDRKIVFSVLSNFLLHSSFPIESQAPSVADTVPITSTKASSLSPVRNLRRNIDENALSHPGHSPKRPRFNMDVDNETSESPTYSVMDLTEEEQLELALKASVDESTNPPTTIESENELQSIVTSLSLNNIDLTSDDSPNYFIEGEHNEYPSISVNIPTSPDASTSIPLSDSQISSAFSSLPKPSEEKLAFRLALRLPMGNRIVLELDPSLQIQVLMRHLNSIGLSESKYELVRIHPRLCISDLPPTTCLVDTGLHRTDNLFLQER